ncbi:hypothetical protein LEP1GSC060_0614 [Leptospira weilii serovar Ranarum str. ICFT]|uniref:CASTOR/POLLUX/SYM8 ion channel conserved domain-containing protein n=1 Tax=Leptospira weilii serovar Ranarum str. ICFT TaxID=1218598 RepID=N1WBT0_9LEPT|nr:hypothetical protein [Leptospira weilii]EMY77716.1 hypothetical protein LEP1GSC060_0614 [Leptospira weilii serovar Ranarum str. ICFT]
MKSNRKFSDQLRYHFDNFMSRGGGAVFAALILLFLIAFVSLSILRLSGGLIFPDESIQGKGEFLWRVFLQISDAGAVAEDGESNWFNKFLGILTVFLGLVLFSSLVAFITNQFDQKIQDLRKGKSDVLEKDHTIILGFGVRVLEIIKELIEANSSESRAVVTVLSEEDKEFMDDYFSENLKAGKTTKIITRSGTPSSLHSLRKVNASEAKSVLVLNSSGGEDSKEGRNVGDAKVLKSLMALVAVCRDRELPPIVAELHNEENRMIAQELSSSIQVMDERNILAKLLVQTSRTSGLAVVYSNLVGFEGDEIYFYKPSSGWKGLDFKEISFRFNESVPLGFRKGNGEMILNPSSDYVPNDEEDAVLLAEDDSKIRFSETAVASPRDFRLPEIKRSVPIDKQLIVGWNSKSPLIVEEYAKFVSPGSTIDILVKQIDEEFRTIVGRLKKKYPEVTLRAFQADLSQESVMKRLEPESYDSVIFLAEEKENIEEVDAQTISLLLRFRQYFRRYTLKTGNQPSTQLITEIMNSENTEIVLETGVKDFLISNQFVSKMMAQVSQEPDVMRVYEDLFSPEGSEIYLKPASLYFETLPQTLSFADCVGAALKRGETCFGIRMSSEEKDEKKGYGVYLIPSKDVEFPIRSEDNLIVLAEDQT